jgi:hypothetical protein
MAPRFRTGDRVRFLHEKQEGVVQKVISPNQIEVLVDDFVEMVVSPDEIVLVDRSEEKVFGTFADKAPEKKAAAKTAAALHPEINIVKTDDHEYEFWLVNPTQDQLLYTLHLKQRHKFEATASGILEPGREKLIAVMESNAFHELQSSIFQMLRFREGEKGLPAAPFQLELSIRQEVINRQPEELPSLKRKGYAFLLTLEALAPETPLEEYAPKKEVDLRKSFVKQAPAVVDLHIEKLVKNQMGLSSAAMLQIQLEHFEKRLTDGLMQGVTEMVFIHGIGDGVLKREIEKKLKGFSFVKGWRLGEPRTYGNGATVVEMEL